MKRILLFSVIAGCALSFSFAEVASAYNNYGYGCKRKEKILESKIEYAKQYGNHGQLRGLEEALQRVRTWCTDGGLRSKAELKVLDKQEKVEERQAELDEAMREGKKRSKIAKRERKLQEAKDELARAVRERDTLN